MIISFLQGIIAASGALIAELGLSIFGLEVGSTALAYLAIIASIEEFLKYIFIRHSYLRGRKDGNFFLQALFLGAGFALVDVITKELQPEKPPLVPLLGICLVHLITASIWGLFFRKSNSRSSIVGETAILLINIALHLGYNLMILSIR